jgi:hypothetical protein
VMDTRRARDELGWEPKRSAVETILDLLAGLREEAGADTPPLAPGKTRRPSRAGSGSPRSSRDH